MPTATSFNALGHGNGFPYCPEKIDVNGNANGQPIIDYVVWDLATAMKMYWNIHSFTIANNPSITEIKNGDAYEEGSPDMSDYTKVEPYWRVCEDNFPRGYQVYFLTDPFDVNDGDFGIEIASFYDGDTSNEDNFIGYGLQAFTSMDDGAAFFTNASDSSQNGARLGTYITADEPSHDTTTIAGVEFIRILQNTTGDAQVEITDITFYDYPET